MTQRHFVAAPASSIRVAGSSSVSPSRLAEAPHRLLFFAGAANVLLAMAWWTLWLVDARVHPLGLPQPPIHAGWLHAIVMQYLVLPPFFFGFLLTVFPRWMNQPPLSPWHYVPVGVGLIGGQVLTLAGLVGVPTLLHAGVLVTMGGWLVGLALLSRIIWRDRGRTWHALSCAVALGAGFVGLAAYAAYLHVHDARLMFFAIKVGSFGLLLPVFVTVAHRMFPFFARGAVIGYTGWNPLPWLGAFWVLVAIHVGLELRHAYAWLWLPDGALATLTAVWLWRNWPRGAMPPLLRVLFWAYVWLPTAFALFAAQAAWYAATGSFALGRAPAHALFVGFFGSLLVAMVTRVTQGHSGRPLVLGALAGFAFVAIQAVALLRIAAEILPTHPVLQALAAAGWLLAFAPWALRSARVYLSVRADRKPG